MLQLRKTNVHTTRRAQPTQRILLDADPGPRSSLLCFASLFCCFSVLLLRLCCFSVLLSLLFFLDVVKNFSLEERVTIRNDFDFARFELSLRRYCIRSPLDAKKTLSRSFAHSLVLENRLDHDERHASRNTQKIIPFEHSKKFSLSTTHSNVNSTVTNVTYSQTISLDRQQLA